MECSADELKRALDQLGQELNSNLHFETCLHGTAAAIGRLAPFIEKLRGKDSPGLHHTLVQAFDFLNDLVRRRAEIHEAARTVIVEGRALVQQCH